MNETLYSILSGSERKRLQLYDSDKNFLLYKKLLDEDNFGTIEALSRAIHETAASQMEDITYREEKMKDIMNAAHAYHKDFLRQHKDLTPTPDTSVVIKEKENATKAMVDTISTDQNAYVDRVFTSSTIEPSEKALMHQPPSTARMMT